MSSSLFIARVGPALYPSKTYLNQAQDLIAISAGLTDTQKMIARVLGQWPTHGIATWPWGFVCPICEAAKAASGAHAVR